MAPIALARSAGTEESQAALQNASDRLKSQQFPAGAVLDLITAAEVRGSEELKAAVAQFRQRQLESGTVIIVTMEGRIHSGIIPTAAHGKHE